MASREGFAISSDPRVRSLVERVLETDETPENVCQDTPELLGEVRAELQQVVQLRAELATLFSPDDTKPPSGELGGATPQIPGYELEALIGRGGMGVVYRARHLRLGRTVALKVLLTGAQALPSELARFRREAEVVAALRHPNIVQVYDVGDADGIAWFTMEFVAGTTLADHVREHVAPRQAAMLLATLGRAIQHAHDEGIVHRDLKPSNVLIAEDGTPKISDFGLARRIDRATALTMGEQVGTPNYMAPEQVSGRDREVGPPADIHALGAILYELLTGQPPFKGPNVVATLHQVLHTDPSPP